MHPLDFISDSPNLFILHKESNKTNFGGVIFLLYIIVMILIVIYYCVNYSKNNNKYTIQSLMHFNFHTEEELKRRNNDDKFNQNISFYLHITFNNTVLDDKFKIYNITTGQDIDRNKEFYSRTNDFFLMLYYKCEEVNCTDYERKFMNKDYLNERFSIDLIYDGFSLEHQNEDEPIQKDWVFIRNYNLYFNKFTIINNIWENIFYYEKKSFIFGEEYNKSCGYIDEYFKYEYNFNTNNSKVYLARIKISNDYLKYIEYKRVKYSLIEVFGNVFSLLSNLLFSIRFAFTFYSKKFNNYKIIENILTVKRKRKFNKPNFSIELTDSINDENKNKTFEPLIEKGNNTEHNDKITNNLNEKKINSYDNDESKETLKKLHFFDFILNNIYYDFLFKKNNSQQIINGCNEIISNYASLDSIIYNQILLENLLKDYKWNNPELNNIECNNLITELKILGELNT